MIVAPAQPDDMCVKVIHVLRGLQHIFDIVWSVMDIKCLKLTLMVAVSVPFCLAVIG